MICVPTVYSEAVTTLDQFSVLLLLSAMGVYAVAFVAFAMDLARRSSEAGVAESTTAAAEAQLGRREADGSVATLTRVAPPTDAVPTRRVAMRVGVSLTVLAWVLHIGAVVLRGLAAGRVPWGNMYEFCLTASALVITVFLASLLRVKLAYLGSIITGFVLVLLGVDLLQFRVDVAPLPPALQSYWLVIHVFVATLASAFFTLGGALCVVQLLQARRERRVQEGLPSRLRLLMSFPTSEVLERTAYRVNIVGFILWTFTLIAGAIWAEHAWGRYWGWDTKEVWTFIIWVIYAGYIHARATRGWRGTRASWLALVGYAAVLFNFGVVNVFFHGLHAYSGLSS